MTMFVFNGQAKMVVDSAMAATLVFGLVAAVVCAAHTVTREIRNGTVLLLLSKPVPRWASLRSNEVYARSGPTKENKVLWTYRQKNLPVQIISDTREWRMICDPDGGIAWVNRSMLKSQRSVVSMGTQKIDLLSGAKSTAKVKARLNPRSLATLDKCKKGYCKVSVGNVDGWAPQDRLWGAQEGAACKRPDPFTRLGASQGVR